MYMFDKNGIEVAIDDLVYFNDENDVDDLYCLNQIGKIVWVNHNGEIAILDYAGNKVHYRTLQHIQKLPETVWTLLLLEGK